MHYKVINRKCNCQSGLSRQSNNMSQINESKGENDERTKAAPKHPDDSNQRPWAGNSSSDRKSQRPKTARCLGIRSKLNPVVAFQKEALVPNSIILSNLGWKILGKRGCCQKVWKWTKMFCLNIRYYVKNARFVLINELFETSIEQGTLEKKVASFCMGLDEFLFVPIWIEDALLEMTFFLRISKYAPSKGFRVFLHLLPGVIIYVISKYHTLAAMTY